MTLFTGIAVYIIIWWVLLFVVLPLGVRSQHEDGDWQAGTDPGAPLVTNLRKKLLITSLLAAAVWLVVWAVITFQIIQAPRYDW